MGDARFDGQRVVLMGLGRFGGGVGAARYLVGRGGEVLVTDTLHEAALADSLAQLNDLPADRLSFRLGAHREDDFRAADLVVANPAVKPDNPYLAAARDAGVPVTSEIRLLVQEVAVGDGRLRTIGVTGSAGKSTVTAMIGHILTKVGDRSVWVGGNLGGSLLPRVDDIADDDWLVLELSSFMLHGLREDRWSPHIAVVTNLTPNHLDWHGSFEAYREAKRTIYRFQSDGDTLIRGEDVPPLAPDVTLAVPGGHNRVNAALAIAAARGLTGKASSEALAGFSGLPHRLRFVGARPSGGGVRGYNDSKATVPEAAMLAIDAVADLGPVHVILGGKSKGSDLTPLARHAAAHCAGIYTIGDTGDAIADAAEAAGGAAVHRCGDLDTAVCTALAAASPGDVLLLSPGCSSLDQFDSYEARGERFAALVAPKG